MSSGSTIPASASKASKALIITYYWPPSGGAGVQRWLKFSKYLPQSGWEPVVLTIDPEYATYPAIDPSMESDIPGNLEIHKTRATDWFKISVNDKSKIPSAGFASGNGNGLKGKIMRFVRGNFFIPDPRKGWNKFAVAEAGRLIKEEGIQHIITTSPPHSTQLIGLKLKKKYPHIKWIADLRDPWTDIYYYDQFYPTFISKAIDRSYEKKVLMNADKVITVGQSLKDLFTAKVPLLKDKITVITNGYDEDDFENLTAENPDKFTISYIGTLSDTYPVESITQALQNLRQKGSEITLRFTGTVSSYNEEKIRLSAGEKFVQFLPYAEHTEALKEMMSSSLLLLIIPKHASSKSIITGKIFEYIASGKPVLCIGPVDGDAARIIAESGAGKTFDYDDVNGIEVFIGQVLAGNLESLQGNKTIYSRKALAVRLADFLK
jgi:glycosyltransferase involved in cell wall biosynthesis